MKKHILRQKRSRRTQIAGWALAAVLAAFPAGQTMGDTLNVGPGKLYSTMEDLRLKREIWNSDVIVVHSDDHFMVGPLRLSLPEITDIASIRADGTTDRIVSYAGLKKAESRVVAVERGTFHFGEHLVFTSSKQTEYGGVGVVSSYGTISVDGTRFESNSADLGGAVFHNDGATLDVKNAFFKKNEAFSGGGFYLDGGVTTLTGVNATNNSARQGGVVYHADGVLTVSGSTFNGNHATQVDDLTSEAYGEGGFGGALVVAGGQVELKNSDFIGNNAAVSGGAVYVTGQATLNVVADEGAESVWKDNLAGVVSNSLFFDLDTADTAQQLNIYGGGTVFMHDALLGTKSEDNNSSLSIRKWGSGKWYLGGKNVFEAVAGSDATMKTTVDITAGTLEFGKDAGLTLNGDGTFTLREGATLSSLGNNLISVNNVESQTAIVVESGSRIELNMSAGGDHTTPMLTFDGWSYDKEKKRPESNMSFGTITVDVTVVNAYNGNVTYELVYANGVDFSGATLLINGVAPSSLTPSDNDRIGTRTIEAVSSTTGVRTVKDKIVLTLTGVDENRTVFWDGTTDATWSESKGNWYNEDGDPVFGSSVYFLNGDDVVFADKAKLNRNITVDKSGVQFGTMTVLGDYAFSGGALNGDKIIFADDATLTFNVVQIPDTDPSAYAHRTLNLSMEIDAGVNGTIVAGENEILTVTAKSGDSAVTGQTGSTFRLGQSGSMGEIRFVGNSGSGNGGAFDGNTFQVLGGTNLFSDNKAAGNGGAIHAQTVNIEGGAVSFKNNAAALLGGAIYATGNVRLAALDGDIVFSGNTQGGVANAVYMTNATSNTLKLSTAAGRKIVFSDPVENVASGRSVSSFTVDISGAGTVLFENDRSQVRGVTTVSGGTMQLAKGAVYGAASGNSEFILKKGAVLQTDSSGTGISADTIRLEIGSTIRLDLSGATGSNALLNLDGNLALQDVRGINLDVIVTSQDGTYLLLESGNTDFQGKFIEMVNGVALDENIANDRYGTRKFSYELGAVSVELKDFDQNQTVIWTGQADNTWGESGANWAISGSNKKYFLNGDDVVFNDSGQNHSIDIVPGGVLVSSMKVHSGNYTFNGGDISKIDDGVYRTLEKSGPGTLTLNQCNTFDLVDVKGGILAGGTAKGSTIVGDLLFRYNAALSPGSSGAGLFHVNGDVQFQAGSYLYLDLGRTEDKSDRLIAAGSIDFSSDQQGTVTIVVSGNAVAKGMSTYSGTVIESGDGLFLNGTQLVNGTTDERNEKVTIQRGANKIIIQSDGSLDLVSAVVSDKGSSMAINAVGAFDAPSPDQSFSWNQLSVRESLENAPVRTFANQLMAQLALTDDGAKAAFLEQLLPTLNSAMPKVTQRAVTQYRQVMFDRLRNLNHEHHNHYIPTPEHTDFQQNNTVRGQRHCPNAAPITWFHNYGDFMHQQRRDVQGYDSYSYGVAIGTDFWLDRSTVFGFGISGAFASVNTEDKSQKADANTFLITPYISHVTGDGYRIMGSMGYAYNDYDIQRHPGGTEVRSKHDGSLFLANVEVSRKFYGDWTDMTPYLGADLIYLHEEGYNEKSDGAVVSRVSPETTSSFLQTLGVRFGRTRRNCFGWQVNPSVSLGWIHDYGDGNVRTVSNYAGGARYTIRGSSMNRDRFAFGLNYDAVFNERISFFTGYNGEFASRYDVHTVQLGCTFEF